MATEIMELITERIVRDREPDPERFWRREDDEVVGVSVTHCRADLYQNADGDKEQESRCAVTLADARKEAAELFPLSEGMAAKSGGKPGSGTGDFFVITQPFNDPRRSRMTRGGLSNTWDPKFEANVMGNRRRLYAETRAKTSAALNRGHTIYKVDIPWYEPAACGKSDVHAQIEAMAARLGRRAEKGAFAEYIVINQPESQKSVIFTTQDVVEGAVKLENDAQVRRELQDAVAGAGVGKYAGHASMARAHSMSRGWHLPGEEPPPVERPEHRDRKLGTLQADFSKAGAFDEFVEELQAEASARGLTVDVNARCVVEVSAPSGMPEEEARANIGHCWRAMGAAFLPDVLPPRQRRPVSLHPDDAEPPRGWWPGHRARRAWF